MINLMQGDCLEEMRKIPEQSIDMVLCDPPYGITSCKWDSVIDLHSMWNSLSRIVKPNAAIVITSMQPFTSALVMSNVRNFRYELIWQKTLSTGHLNAKKMPMRSHENISIFYKKLPTYNPIKTFGHKRKTVKGSDRSNRAPGVYGKQYECEAYDSTERYPTSIQKFSSGKNPLHPTQKPVALMEYLIKTYTNKGDAVLDFAMGSGTTGVACKNLDRKFVGIELDEAYFNVAAERIKSIKGVTIEKE